MFGFERDFEWWKCGEFLKSTSKDVKKKNHSSLIEK